MKLYFCASFWLHHINNHFQSMSRCNLQLLFFNATTHPACSNYYYDFKKEEIIYTLLLCIIYMHILISILHTNFYDITRLLKDIWMNCYGFQSHQETLDD